jgi:hypothetical protein
MAIDPKIQAQIDALEAAFMQARGGGEDFRTALPNLSPELLDFILKSQAQDDGSGNGMYRGTSDPSGAGFYQYAGYNELNPNASPEASARDTRSADWSQSPLQFGVNSDTSNYLANYDQQGRFTGYEIAQDDNNWRDAITAALMLAPAVAGVYGWAGAAGEGGAAAGAGGSGGAGGGAGGFGGEALSGMDLAADAALGTGNNITTAGAGLSGAAPAGTTGLDAFRQGEIGGYQTNGSMPGSAASQGGNMTALDQAKVAMTGTTGTEGLIGSGGNMAGTGTGSTAGLNSGGLLGTGISALTGGNGDVLGGLLGAYLGYQQSKDQQQTQSRDPWGPAQPYLQGLLHEGAGIYDQYKKQPFSQAEQVAYANLGNTHDFINANAGGLMDGFVANASGQNQFQRGKPRGLIGSSYNPATSPVAWQPGLLDGFGTAPPRKKVM